MAVDNYPFPSKVRVDRHNIDFGIPPFSPCDAALPNEEPFNRLKSVGHQQQVVVMKRERIPPGQHKTDGFPVLNVERPMKFNREKWRFRVTGEVDRPLELTWDQFLAMPSFKLVADFHCVTGWSRLDNEWEGILGRTICEEAKIRPTAKHVVMIADSGYTSNTPIETFLRDDTILAYRWGGKELEPKHGGPLRSVISSIYAYKSVKWLVGLKFVESDEPGYWEVRGYHNEADPWREERHSFR